MELYETVEGGGGGGAATAGGVMANAWAMIAMISGKESYLIII